MPTGSWPLEEVVDPLKGRCYAATRDLSPGDTVMIVEPAAAVVFDEAAENCCAWCFRVRTAAAEAGQLQRCNACQAVYYCRVCDDCVRPIGTGFYAAAVPFNHSCRANCHQFHVGRVLHVRCIHPVKRGQELTISYVPLESITAARRRELKASYFFDCDCARCCGGAAGGDARLARVACCGSSRPSASAQPCGGAELNGGSAETGGSAQSQNGTHPGSSSSSNIIGDTACSFGSAGRNGDVGPSSSTQKISNAENYADARNSGSAHPDVGARCDGIMVPPTPSRHGDAAVSDVMVCTRCGCAQPAAHINPLIERAETVLPHEHHEASLAKGDKCPGHQDLDAIEDWLGRHFRKDGLHHMRLYQLHSMSTPQLRDRGRYAALEADATAACYASFGRPEHPLVGLKLLRAADMLEAAGDHRRSLEHARGALPLLKLGLGAEHTLIQTYFTDQDGQAG
ncbi:hypothetical protein JKP88DRAFT_265924 [Tribonema minus]|uniref:SET domain-containing protein n=1 Tax=Tribonema minus TaxID=303371 RepID=A0A836C891_9STRA|nr:hypothetical protein JKP88DRAFT_265924 [Tribonema minus]